MSRESTSRMRRAAAALSAVAAILLAGAVDANAGSRLYGARDEASNERVAPYLPAPRRSLSDRYGPTANYHPEACHDCAVPSLGTGRADVVPGDRLGNGIEDTLRRMNDFELGYRRPLPSREPLTRRVLPPAMPELQPWRR